jgi:hypothetical protein
LFVREALNPDHALILAELIRGGVKLPPIKVTPDLTVIDGRHRIEGCTLNDITEVECEVVEVAGEVELIAAAYQANLGGSLPPTSQDTEHVVTLLLERGESHKNIAGLLRLPINLVRKYIKSVQSRMARAKMQKALTAVAEEGLTVPKAAEKYAIDEEQLREHVSGKRRKRRQGVAEIKGNLSTAFKSFGLKNAHLLRSITEKFDDGDMTQAQVEEVYDHLEHLQGQSARSLRDSRKRFDAKVGNRPSSKAKSA